METTNEPKNQGELISKPNPADFPMIQGVYKAGEFIQFAEWIALPAGYRNPKNQTDLSLELNIGEGTLSEWKKHPQFWMLVGFFRKQWGKERTGSVVAAVFTEALKGNPLSQKLWLQYVEDWGETQNVNERAVRKYIITRGEAGSEDRPVPGSIDSVASESIESVEKS